MSISTTEPVFEKFKSLPNCIFREDVDDPRKRFLYMRGSRKNKLVLVAHADTVWDSMYDQYADEPDIIFENGCFYSNIEGQGIGADDRAGCAMLWLLRESGHSILILGSEEQGQIAAKWIIEEHPDIADEINYEHQFVVEFDVPGFSIYKTYSVGTEEFQNYLEEELNYEFKTRFTSDIDTLCTTVCGTNIAIGYYKNHTEDEYLDYSEWLNVVNDMKTWLSKPEFPRFER
jgi:hypothetical protein